jgi:hypothetical protein
MKKTLAENICGQFMPEAYTKMYVNKLNQNNNTCLQIKIGLQTSDWSDMIGNFPDLFYFSLFLTFLKCAKRLNSSFCGVGSHIMHGP